MRGAFAPVGSVRDRLGLPDSAPYPHWLVERARSQSEDRRAASFVYLAWELSRALPSGTTFEDVEAFQTLVVAALLGLDEGNTRIPLSSLSLRFGVLGASDGLAARAQSLLDPARRAEGLVGHPPDDKPLLRDGDYLYLQRVHRQECRLAEHVRSRLNAKVERSDFKVVLDALDAVLAHRPVRDGKPIRLSTEQQQAIRTAVTRPLTLVSGGAGAGKIAIVAAVLRVLARLGVSMENVTLAAPDGRARLRLQNGVRRHLEAIPEPGRPDLSLIESLPEARDLRRRELPEKLVLVAEAEKLDVDTMEWLFRSLHSDSKLVLLGDVDQLASVESGGVFRELLHRSAGAIALKENHRRNLLDVVRAVALGAPEALLATTPGAIAVRERAADIRFEGVELLVADEDAFLERWYEECVRLPDSLAIAAEAIRPPVGEDARPTLERLAAHFHRHRVLGPTRREVSSWNEKLDRGQPCRPVVSFQNGDDGELGVELRSSLSFGGDTFRRGSALAYAETVRESQGSLFDRVAVVLPEPDHRLLFRHFLTSALTQGRESAIVLGSREAVLAAAARLPDRSTGLGERLTG